MRPQKARIIEALPQCKRFSPDGQADPEETVITLDMLEALRLVDALGLSLLDAARSMDISAPTLCRLVGEARARVARALCAGNVIVVEGGNIALRVPESPGAGAGNGHGRRMRSGRGGPVGQCRGARNSGMGPRRGQKD